MSLNPLYLRTSISIYNDQIISTTKCNPPIVHWYWASHCSELYFILSWEKVDLWHWCSIKNTWDHLRFVKNCFLEVCTSEWALIEQWVGEISVRDNTIIKVNVWKHIVHFTQQSERIRTCLGDVFKLLSAENDFK